MEPASDHDNRAEHALALALNDVLARNGGFIQTRSPGKVLIRATRRKHLLGALLVSAVLLLFLWDYYAYAWLGPLLALAWLITNQLTRSDATRAWLRHPWQTDVLGTITADSDGSVTTTWS